MCASLSNRLLDSLSPNARRSLESSLTAVPLPVGTTLFEQGVEPMNAYFITSGIASVISDMAGGSVVEVELLGREALPGSLQLLGKLIPSTHCQMQVAGTGLRISFKELREQFRFNPEFHSRILQHVQYKAFTLSQLSACNQLHGVEGRLGRLLLMVADRIEEDVLPLTQEFLAQMLGTRRSTITVIAGALQKAGSIEYHRGRLHIVHRAALEHVACECYSTLRKYHRDLYVAPFTSQNQFDANLSSVRSQSNALLADYPAARAGSSPLTSRHLASRLSQLA